MALTPPLFRVTHLGRKLSDRWLWHGVSFELRAGEALGLVGPSGFGKTPTFLTLQGTQLSGGEAQLLALLRALQLNPQVLLLDEPTASLDPDTTAQVEALISSWLQQPDHVCLLTSHARDQIRRITHRQLQLGEFV